MAHHQLEPHDKTMLTLYHSPDSRSSRIIWLPEEIGAKYEVAYCSIVPRSNASHVTNRHIS
jgi:glutathione S-transferase